MTETDSDITRGYRDEIVITKGYESITRSYNAGTRDYDSITRSYRRGGEVIGDITRGYREYNEKL